MGKDMNDTSAQDFRQATTESFLALLAIIITTIEYMVIFKDTLYGGTLNLAAWIDWGLCSSEKGIRPPSRGIRGTTPLFQIRSVTRGTRMFACLVIGASCRCALVEWTRACIIHVPCVPEETRSTKVHQHSSHRNLPVEILLTLYRAISWSATKGLSTYVSHGYELFDHGVQATGSEVKVRFMSHATVSSLLLPNPALSSRAARGTRLTSRPPRVDLRLLERFGVHL